MALVEFDLLLFPRIPLRYALPGSGSHRVAAYPLRVNVAVQAFFLLAVNGRFLFDVSKRKWGFKQVGFAKRMSVQTPALTISREMIQ